MIRIHVIESHISHQYKHKPPLSVPTSDSGYIAFVNSNLDGDVKLINFFFVIASLVSTYHTSSKEFYMVSAHSLSLSLKFFTSIIAKLLLPIIRNSTIQFHSFSSIIVPGCLI